MLRKTQGLYIISVAAQILEMHPQTLRKYERAGFIEPPRMGTLRLYSEEDITRLRLIKYFVEELGLNLAGVDLALNMTNKLLALRAKLARQGDPETARDEAVGSIDRLLYDLGIEVSEEPARPERGSAAGPLAGGHQRAETQRGPGRIKQEAIPKMGPQGRDHPSPLP
ncbi:MAG: MerR family transcriptional regulator [Chloroflexi bacterium]|nr:MerR family transcriptional regulator [Chloroflexota bacterium]